MGSIFLIFLSIMWLYGLNLLKTFKELSRFVGIQILIAELDHNHVQIAKFFRGCSYLSFLQWPNNVLRMQLSCGQYISLAFVFVHEDMVVNTVTSMLKILEMK